MKTFLNTPTNMSIVWGITLALITLLDWNTLENNPMTEEILTPFISRHITLAAIPDAPATEIPGQPQPPATLHQLQYQVELEFNGPLFLLCFFLPPALFFGLAALSRKARSQ
ncbi:MAG: hypothetical protein AseanaTS_27810 [Candidatus Pelagadaptatus aseana]|uniref:hypothetical protein n=1 Tax=Candidatus Pelagadaptatus aseana TaxID=3120508 RepID=UPI0039B3204A